METIVPDDFKYRSKGSKSATTPMRDTSSSRASLRERLSQRRTALTEREHRFLAKLCVDGDEIEVQLANERLLDTDLFFDRYEEANKGDHDSNFITNTSGIFKAGFPSIDTSESSFSSMGVGSQRRIDMLEERKKYPSFGNMWKAHSTGLGLTKQASRRSLIARRQSLSSVSSSRMDLYNRPETEDIFRRSMNIKNAGSPMNDIRSDNNRRASVTLPPLSMNQSTGHSHSNNLRSSRRSSLRNPSRPSLRRMLSDGSRKSVSFRLEPPVPGKLSDRIKSEGCATSKPTLHASMDSMSSIPSIYKAQPLRSESICSTTTSSSGQEGPPSIHEANHVHSVTSIPSLHAGQPLTSQSSLDRNQKSLFDTDDEWDETKHDPPIVPNKMELFQKQQMQEDDRLFAASATKLLSHDDPNVTPFGRLVLMRRASRSHVNNTEQGIEVAAYADAARRPSFTQSSIVSGGRALDDFSIKTSLSYDETLQQQQRSIFRRTSAIQRSLSDDHMAGIFLGGSKMLLQQNEFSSSLRASSNNSEINHSWRGGVLLIPNDRDDDDDDSYDLDNEDPLNFYDPWKVIEDEYENGYGGGGTLPFQILGTTGDDLDAQPHVLSPPLMESLQAFLPQAVAGDNYWMKYSLVRDGASLHTFLQHARGATHSVIALETVDGEVFGAFTSEAWRKNWNFFGGNESFLWRMRHTRRERCLSIIDQAHMESEIEVFPYSGQNSCIQLCTHDKIAVGGGTGEAAFEDVPSSPTIQEHDWGFGLSLESDLLHGTTNPCMTFSSPSLSKVHPDGSQFEIVNLELWTLTPCLSLEDAEKLELGKLFLRKHAKEIYM